MIGPAILLSLALSQLVCATDLPSIVVLATGGTIASRQNITQGTSLPSLSGDQLVDAVPALKKFARVRSEQIATVGSRDMTPAIWVRIAARANEKARVLPVLALTKTREAVAIQKYFDN